MPREIGAVKSLLVLIYILMTVILGAQLRTHLPTRVIMQVSHCILQACGLGKRSLLPMASCLLLQVCPVLS